MDARPQIATPAALIGDPARATILTSLLGGECRPATDLARQCQLSPPTVSAHLNKLVAGGLLAMERRGRYRYYRLSGPHVAQALEALGAIAPLPPVRSLRESQVAEALCRARTCYDHLAGKLGVALTDALVANGYLAPAEHGYTLTDAGTRWLEDLGVDVGAAQRMRRAFALQCLDWSERRYHVAGALGAGIAARLFDLGWIIRLPSCRGVKLTPAGTAGLADMLDLHIETH